MAQLIVPEAGLRALHLPADCRRRDVPWSLATRHVLNDYLLNEGGHIGYRLQHQAIRQAPARHSAKLAR